MEKFTILVLLVAVSCACAELTTPTAHWKLDGDGTDEMATYDMTYTSAAVYSTDVVGNSTNSLGEDGDLGIRPNTSTSSYDPLGATYGFGLSLWFKWTEVHANSTDLRKLCQKWGGGTGYDRFFQLYTYGDELGFGLANVYNNASWYYTPNSDLVPDQWYHVGINVFTNGTEATDEVLKIYLTPAGEEDAELVISSTWAPADNAGGTSQIIQCHNSGWMHVGAEGENDSLVDEVYYYRNVDAFSEADIQELYDLGNIMPPPLLEGDANRDGVVSAGDYASVQSNFGNTGEAGIPGDANMDGVVSAGDYASVQANFGSTSSGSVPVPEPASMCILSLGVIALIKKRQ